MNPNVGTAALNTGAGLIDLAFRRRREKRQEAANKRMLKYQAALNERYLDKQLAYNTPEAQMQRYRDAGLNPHLIYGQGNPGNQSAPLSSPDLKSPDYQHAGSQSPIADIVQTAMATMLQMSQVQAVNAKTEKTVQDTALSRLQQQVLAANPSLNPAAYNAIIDGLIATADSKASRARIDRGMADWLTRDVAEIDGKGGYRRGTNQQFKLDAELKLLEQRFDLGTKDSTIKSNIIQSKEFQNAILEVQKKWMTDSDITPQHIYQFVIMLLTKML